MRNCVQVCVVVVKMLVSAYTRILCVIYMSSYMTNGGH